MSEQRIFQVDGQKWAEVTHSPGAVVLSIGELDSGLLDLDLHPEQSRQLGIRLIEEAVLAEQQAFETTLEGVQAGQRAAVST